MKRWRIGGMSSAVLLLLMAAAGCVAAPVYYLNDDVTMRSILSGACTGTPDGHAVYMKYPLTGLLAGMYRISGRMGIFIPWFDLFLAGCILLAGGAVLTACQERWQGSPIWERLLAGLAGVMVFAALMLPQYLYLHYTIVAAILAGGALFLWTSGKARGAALLMLELCYLVRSQVFFLALPFLLVAVLYNLLHAARRDSAPRDSVLFHCLGRQGISLLILALVTVLLMGIDRIGYGSEAWQDYREYNASRTALYDYTDFLSTDRYQEDYEELGLDWEQYQVLSHYDTILDQRIDAQTLERAAGSIRRMREASESGQSFRQWLGTYYRHVRYDGRPYSLVWAYCFTALAVLLALYRRWNGLLLMAVLAAGRSAIWIYLMAQGRFPERVWLSLYMIEICLLLGMLLRECAEGRKAAEGWKRRLPLGVLALCLALLGVVIPGQLLRTGQEVREQQARQDQWNTLTDSLEEKEASLYLVDVFSAVAYAGEVYEKDSGKVLLLGGWLTGSPLIQQRLAQHDAADGAGALQHFQVRLLAAGDRDIAWMEDYLEQRLGAAKLEAQESIACGDGVEFVVYQLMR